MAESRDTVEFYVGTKRIITMRTSIVPLVGTKMVIRMVPYEVTRVSYCIDFADQPEHARIMRANVDMKLALNTKVT